MSLAGDTAFRVSKTLGGLGALRRSAYPRTPQGSSIFWSPPARPCIQREKGRELLPLYTVCRGAPRGCRWDMLATVSRLWRDWQVKKTGGDQKAGKSEKAGSA